MSATTIVILITVYFAVSLLGLYCAVRTVRRYLRKTVKLIRKQRNADLRWHRDSLLAHMRLGEARKR